MKRALAGAGTLAGLVLVAVAVMGFVLLGPSGTWHSEVEVPAGRTAVVIDPALASVLGPRIQIEARAPGQTTALFVGWARPDDTEALLRGTDQFRLTGLDGARQVRVTSSDGNQLIPSPDTLDIWHSRTVGPGAVTLTYRAQAGADAVVIASEDSAPLPALSVRLRWSDRSWLWFPLLLLALGVALVVGLRRWYRPPARRSDPAPANPTRHLSPVELPPAEPSPREPSPREPSPMEPTTRLGRRRAAAKEGQQR